MALERAVPGQQDEDDAAGVSERHAWGSDACGQQFGSGEPDSG